MSFPALSAYANSLLARGFTVSELRMEFSRFAADSFVGSDKKW
jgi:hypothetical protein